MARVFPGNSGLLLNRSDLTAFGATIDLRKLSTTPAGHCEMDLLNRTSGVTIVDSLTRIHWNQREVVGQKRRHIPIFFERDGPHPRGWLPRVCNFVRSDALGEMERYGLQLQMCLSPPSSAGNVCSAGTRGRGADLCASSRVRHTIDCRTLVEIATAQQRNGKHFCVYHANKHFIESRQKPEGLEIYSKSTHSDC